jgi:MoxR-like ATPase
MDLEGVERLTSAMKREIGRVVVGHDAVVEALLVAMLAGGHILVEGVPGTAKTLLMQSFASCLGLELKRVQFTPDLMPGDLLGSNLFDFRTNQFTLTRGPIFTELLLADEINRTPPKTQSALLQAMQERAVTLDGQTHALSEAFLVMATQNPIEQEGTYPLPEAQLDRFLLKVIVGYPTRDEEREVVRRHGMRATMPDVASFLLERVADGPTLAAARAVIREQRLAEEMVDYIVDLVRATRQSPALEHGGSPRSANMLAASARAVAALRGRGFVIPDDVKHVFLPAMRHRVILGAAAEIEGTTADAVLGQILSTVKAPR